LIDLGIKWLKKSNINLQDFYFFDPIEPTFKNENNMILGDIEKK
jgi:hypothetical protein